MFFLSSVYSMREYQSRMESESSGRGAGERGGRSRIRGARREMRTQSGKRKSIGMMSSDSTGLPSMVAGS